MKILVLSDSHSGLSFMRHCIDKLQPQHVIHLGDHYDDATAMAEEHPHIRFHQVPGNCDSFLRQPGMVDIMCYPIGGIKIYMTHGHKHFVKSGIHRLVEDASQHEPQAILFGHTHESLCFQRENGTWVMNPGSCRSWGGTVGLIEVEDGKISACRILGQADMD
jgi:putative phosphoesterase